MAITVKINCAFLKEWERQKLEKEQKGREKKYSSDISLFSTLYVVFSWSPGEKTQQQTN